MVDKRSLFEKITQGGGEYDAADGVSAVAAAAGLLSGPAGQVASVAFSVPSAAMGASRDLAWLSEQFGGLNLEREAATNSLFKHELDAVDVRIAHAVATSAAGAVGGIAGGAAGTKAGAALGTIIMPGVGTAIGGAIGGFGGAIVGSVATSYPMDAILSSSRTDAFAVLGSIQNDLKRGIHASAEKAFVILAASLPEENVKYIESRIKKMSGGEVETLQAALEKHSELISKLMRDPGIDNIIRAHNGLLALPKNDADTMQESIASTSEMFAEKVNAGVDPRILLLRQKRMQLVEVMNQEIVASSVNAQGVYLAPDEEDAHPFPPVGGAPKKGRTTA